MTKTIKNTLKISAITLLLLPIIFMMTACGGNTSIDGTWKIQSMTSGETTKDRTQLTDALTDKTKTLDEQFKLVIKSDNTFTLLVPESKSEVTGTWTQDKNAKEDTYKLTTSDNAVFTVTYESSNTIKVASSDKEYFVMKKA